MRRLDRKPRFVLTAVESEGARHFLQAKGLAGGPVIGVQWQADERYRDVPHMAAIVERLAAEFPVLVFAARPPADLPASARVVPIVGTSLRKALSLLSRCAVVVAPDSAFLHAAAALDVPAVGLFGPTDGRVRTRDYPLALPLDARLDYRCVPCWRNDDIACALTGLQTSACLQRIDPDRVLAAVRARAEHARSLAPAV